MTHKASRWVVFMKFFFSSKLWLSAVLLFLLALDAAAQQQHQNLRFTKDDKFKIVQFTDIHFQNESIKSEKSLQMMAHILDLEKPDLVVLTGDIITSRPAEKGWNAVVQPMIEREIPWAVTLGNHDDEQDLSRQEIIAVLKDLPYSLVQAGPEDIGGGGNYVLEIKNSEETTAALIYCQDSNAYTTIEGVGSYGWFTFEQIAWYRDKSKKFTKANNGQPQPSLAFFHIPVPEYKEIWDSPQIICIGQLEEEVCSPVINTGMFAAILECGDVMGVFVGHDHVNDYAGVLHGICLAYGRASGYDSYGDLEKGGRVIELLQGERKFDSWIRTGQGEIVNEIQYPASFESDKIPEDN